MLMYSHIDRRQSTRYVSVYTYAPFRSLRRHEVREKQEVIVCKALDCGEERRLKTFTAVQNFTWTKNGNPVLLPQSYVTEQLTGFMRFEKYAGGTQPLQKNIY